MRNTLIQTKPMSAIQVLPESLINKIAAGEVVDRPFSVVKELMENSIDAGADQIFVTIDQGGKDYISVLDNGDGMSAKDAQLSVERHATSKIATPKDLENVTTMGFRGEALAAIAAVSRFELTTCSDENKGGFQVRIEGGKRIHAAKTGFPKGTRISVENLFFNTPARRKFMKSARTEYGHIHDLIIRLSLGYPSIQFKLVHNKSVILNITKGHTFKQRVRHCFGDEIADDLMECRHEESYLSLSGLISRPNKNRTSRRWQHTFVNDRYVKCLSINHGIYEGYKTLLMKNMHPVFFVKVHVNPSEIDANVHPAKTEIRVKNPNLIHTILANTISGLLKLGTRKQIFTHTISNKTEPEVDQTISDQGGSSEVQSKEPDHENLRVESVHDESMQTKPLFKETSHQLGFTAPNPVQTKERPKRKSTPVCHTSGPAEEIENADIFHFSNDVKQHSEARVLDRAVTENAIYQVIGQLSKKYILAQGDNCLIVVDQHAAHERIRFEEIRGQFYSKELAILPLLIPLMMELPPQDGVLLEQYREEWEKIGFEIDHFGGNDYSIKKIPAILQDRDIPLIIRQVLDEAAQFGKSGKLELFFNEVFEKMACHSSVRSGQKLSHQEMQSLLDQLTGFNLHLSCPHGRPFIIEMPIGELDHRFKRIV